VFPNGYLNFNRFQKDNNFINDSLRLVFKCQACYKIIADVFVNFSLCTHAHSRCVYDMQPKFSFAPSLTPPNFFQLPERGSGANQTEIKSKLSKPLDTPPHPPIGSTPPKTPSKTHPWLSCLSITHHYVNKNGQPANGEC